MICPLDKSGGGSCLDGVPDQEWMEQIGRSATQENWGYLHPCRYVLHDRDAKFLRFVPFGIGNGWSENDSAAGPKPIVARPLGVTKVPGTVMENC